MRDEDSATYRSCAFVGNFAAMALGTHSGEVRLHDTLSGDLIDTIDAHESPVYQLRVSATSCSLQTSSLQLSCTCFHSKISAVVLNDADMLPSCVGHDSCSPEAALQKLRFVRRTTFPAACEISSHHCWMCRSMLLQESLTWHASLPFQSWQSLRKRHVQVYEGSGRSMLLTSCRAEAKLWDVGACRGRAEALWAPNETISDSLHMFEGVRNAIFRQDGLLVTFPLRPHHHDSCIWHL